MIIDFKYIPTFAQNKTNIPMKRIILLLMAVLAMGCSKSEDEYINNSNNRKNELYEITDYFVNSLYDEYNSYGVEGAKYIKKTSDGVYSVMPFYRLIIVKIEKESTYSKYEDLKNDLSQYYKGNWKVNDVYINQAGTLVIDCRR